MSSPVLEVRALSVRFGGLVALDRVDLVVPPQSIVGLVGPNGAGKTTLFDVVSGLTRPADGEVRIHGMPVTMKRPEARSRLGLARTFQRSELFAELTVREHLVLAYRARHQRTRAAADLLGLGRLRRDPRERRVVDTLLEMLELGAVADRFAASLPLGSGRLVEVGRALATLPDVVLLDEPSAGLDEEETDRLAAALRRAQAEASVALLLVEHDVDLVLGISDRVSVLDFGRLIAEGPPDDIRRNPRVQAAYLGTEAGS